ncbi:MAG: TIGR00266 family protein [Planctomycetota bacterium]
MDYEIHGDVMQTVDVWLEEGETVFTESGGMAWMSPQMEMETSAKGGILKSLGRMFSRESFFLTSYTCTDGRGLVTFNSELPGTILPFDLAEGEELICQKDAFMCAEDGVDLSVHLRNKLGAGLFGGEGFIMQKLTGPGRAFIEIDGELTEYELKEGESLKVDPGHIGAIEPGVDMDISRVKGVKNIFFSGEGLFLATVTGPGKVWLQSMPLSNLARTISSRMSNSSS